MPAAPQQQSAPPQLQSQGYGNAGQSSIPMYPQSISGSMWAQASHGSGDRKGAQSHYGPPGLSEMGPGGIQRRRSSYPMKHLQGELLPRVQEDDPTEISGSGMDYPTVLEEAEVRSDITSTDFYPSTGFSGMNSLGLPFTGGSGINHPSISSHGRYHGLLHSNQLGGELIHQNVPGNQLKTHGYGVNLHPPGLANPQQHVSYSQHTYNTNFLKPTTTFPGPGQGPASNTSSMNYAVPQNTPQDMNPYYASRARKL